MSNSIIGKQFTYKNQKVIILDEAKIESIDGWKIRVTIITNIYELLFDIIDYYTYFNFKSLGPVTEVRARELLLVIFDKIRRFKHFTGSFNNNYHIPFQYSKDMFEIYLISED